MHEQSASEVAAHQPCADVLWCQHCVQRLSGASLVHRSVSRKSGSGKVDVRFNSISLTTTKNKSAVHVTRHMYFGQLERFCLSFQDLFLPARLPLVLWPHLYEHLWKGVGWDVRGLEQMKDGVGMVALESPRSDFGDRLRSLVCQSGSVMCPLRGAVSLVEHSGCRCRLRRRTRSRLRAVRCTPAARKLSLNCLFAGRNNNLFDLLSSSRKLITELSMGSRGRQNREKHR